MMRLRRFLASTLLAIVAMQAPASWAQGPAALRASFHDPKTDLRFDVREDGRTLVITNSSGEYLGVFDPLFDGDGGREGTITAIRLPTAAELRHFKRERSTQYVVLSYSAGGLLVVSLIRDAAARPRHCRETGVAIVSRNIACKYDLVEASRRYDEAFIASFLRDGPSTIAPIRVAVPCSDIVLHVEADGRTVWAANKSGARLWTEDPFERAGLKPYRYRRPIIRTISPQAMPSNGRCRNQRRPVVSLQYNSTQFGVLYARTGEFIFGGQD
jgi:hypothetical protein